MTTKKVKKRDETKGAKRKKNYCYAKFSKERINLVKNCFWGDELEQLLT